jgi:hypothetical protein
MTTRTFRLAAFVVALFVSATAYAEIEIVLQNGFIEAYKDRATIDANFIVDKAHERPNPPSKDGDLHIAGRADEVKLPMVAEIMNAKDETAAVNLVHALEGTGQAVPLSGFWRLWCEHGGTSRQVQGEALEAFHTTNPDHVFQIHPVTNLNGRSLLGSLREINGFETKDAERAFTKYEDLFCEIVPKENSTVIRTRMAGYNYVEFAMSLSPEGERVVDDGRFAFAEVYDLDGELLVRKRRMVFVKDSEPEIKTRSLPEGTLVHVLGMPRINLALVDWRCKEATREGGNKEVLTWSLPYEIMVVGYYGVLEEHVAEEAGERRALTAEAVRAPFIPHNISPNEAREELFERESDY